MANYKDWIKNIDIEIDYFAAFLKAYIAFNSWYKGEYPTTTDRGAIDTIKDTDNIFRRYMINLLATNASDDNPVFLDTIAKLHNALCNSAITTQEFGGVRKPISFTEIAIKNATSQETHTFRTVTYLVKREKGKYKTSITDKNGVQVFFEEQEKYDLDELTSMSSFALISSERQAQLKVCYGKIPPYKTKSILFGMGERGYEDSNVKKVGMYEFVSNEELIAKGLIEVIYLLRCSLAHGDVAPDKNANNVYHYAYELLAMVLKRMS